MKLCVLTSKIDAVPLYEFEDLYLYHIPIDEYKKCILKGVVNTNTNSNARSCHLYAVLVLKGKFELGEEYISKDAMFSGRYACEVLEGKFVLGEDTISKDPHYSYLYALSILKGRFILGEESIKHSYYQRVYENKFNIKL